MPINFLLGRIVRTGEDVGLLSLIGGDGVIVRTVWHISVSTVSLQPMVVGWYIRTAAASTWPISHWVQSLTLALTILSDPTIMNDRVGTVWTYRPQSRFRCRKWPGRGRPEL